MAGQLQLEATGPQERFFTLDPDYSHFLESFKKHSNFSNQYVDLDPENEANFGKKVKFKVPQNQGDLLKTLSLKLKLPEINTSGVCYIESVGHAIIEYVDLIVGGKVIQRLTSDYLQIYSEHFVTQTKQENTKRDYLITQIQQNTFDVGVGVNEGTFKLDFINPVKELYFVVQRQGTAGDGVTQGNFVTPFDYDNLYAVIDDKLILYENLDYLTLTFDGQDIITQDTGNVLFLKAIQAAIHHSKTQLIRRFYSYSFALQPEEWYPTGQINLSLIKEQLLTMNLTSSPDFARQIRVYAESYNILRVSEGIAETLFNVKY
jgi:hypothetical protein